MYSDGNASLSLSSTVCSVTVFYLPHILPDRSYGGAEIYDPLASYTWPELRDIIYGVPDGKSFSTPTISPDTATAVLTTHTIS